MKDKSEFIDKIVYGDALETMKEMPNDFVSLIFTSPPYNVNIPYQNHEDNMPYDVYLNWLKDIMIESKRVLRKGGRLAINIDAATIIKKYRTDDYIRAINPHLYNIGKEVGLFFRTEIFWYKQNAPGKKTAWGSYVSCSNPVIRRNHEYVLVWSKDDWQLEGDSEQSDMTPEEFSTYTFSSWLINPETRNLGGHPVPFPEELAKRVIKLYSYRGDVVLDMFSGTGTTAYVAHKYGRKYIGIDNDKKWCDFATERIKEFDNTNTFPEPYVVRSERLKQFKDLKLKKSEEESLLNEEK